jgi:OTU domain-containing protein 5
VPFDKIEIFRQISFSDWEATNEAIEEQVARESYLQWLRDNERRNKSQMERSSTVTSGRFPDLVT